MVAIGMAAGPIISGIILQFFSWQAIFWVLLIPIGLAIVSIVVALGATSLLGQAFELIFFITLMITMIEIDGTPITEELRLTTERDGNARGEHPGSERLSLARPGLGRRW